MRATTMRIVAWAAMTTIAAGCGATSETTEATPASSEAASSPASPGAALKKRSESAADASETAKKADEDPAVAPASEKATEDRATAYEPPFPNRVELFSPPKRLASEQHAGGPTEESVTLLGFIRLDRDRAILAFNGESLPVAEGETHYGVEIVSIRPPSVVLQRGRERWQTSLSD